MTELAYAVARSGTARAHQDQVLTLRRVTREAKDSIVWALGADAQPPGFVALSTEKAKSIAGAPECWVHLATFGKWNGHPAGPFEFSRALFDALIARLDAQKNPVPWTIGHPWGTEAAPGWLRRLAVMGDGSGEHDGLYGLTEWTAAAATQIREGGWRYCSVVVDLESVDRVTGQVAGPELIEVGLTNKPFIDGQKQIELSREGRKDVQMAKALDPEAILKQVKKDLGLPDSASPDKVKTMVDHLCAIVATMSDDAGGGAATDVAAAAKLPAEAQALFLARVAKLGKKLAADGRIKLDDSPNWTGGGTMAPEPDGDETDVGAALQAAGIDVPGFLAWIGNADNVKALMGLMAGPADQAAMGRQSAELLTLRASVREGTTKLEAAVARVAELEAAETARKVAAVDAERESAIKAAKDDGRITAEATETEVREVFKLSHEAGKRMLAALPHVVPTGRHRPTAPATPTQVRKDGAVEFDFTPRDETEAVFCTRHQRSPVTLKRLLTQHRARVADQTQGTAAG